MRTFSEFLQQRYYLPNGDYKTWQEYLDINNLIEESITEESIEQFDLYNYCKFCPYTWEPRLGNGYANYVSEMLNSTEFSKLIT